MKKKAAVFAGGVSVFFLLAGLAQVPPRLEFEAASIKAPPPGPGRNGFGGGKRISSDPSMLRMRSADATEMIVYAYSLGFGQLKGAPEEFGRWDIDAKTPFPATEPQEKIMLQGLLAERFHLTFHHEQQDLQGYALIAGKTPTPALPHAAPDAVPGIRMAFNKDMNLSVMNYEAKGTTMAELAAWVARSLGAPVVDQSGIEGKFDFSLRVNTNPDPDTPVGANSASIHMSVSDYVAALKKLGLDLKPQRSTVDVLVVDRFEKPSMN